VTTAVQALGIVEQTDALVNSRDTILHLVKDQAYCKSGIMSPEYPEPLLFQVSADIS